MTPNPSLQQYFTPLWAAQALLEEYFGHLTKDDLLCDPTCGIGAFLQAATTYGIPSFGVEIDPVVADEAIRRTGAPVIVGDFRTVSLGERQPTVLIGNPPFSLRLSEAILDRAHQLLPPGGLVGMILPAYYFQSTSTTLKFNSRWSIATDMIPRELFARLSYPLVFARFRKDPQRTLIGFALYRECHSLKELLPASRELLRDGKPRKGVWHALVDEALTRLGGQATLAEIYAVVAPNRLPSNNYWREKIRQVLQRHYHPISRGVWALPAPATV